MSIDQCLFKQHPALVSQTRASMYNTVSVSPGRFPCLQLIQPQPKYSSQGKTLQAISHAKQTENTLLNAYTPRCHTRSFMRLWNVVQ